MAHVARDGIEVEGLGSYEGRHARLDDWNVAFERIPAGFPPGGGEAFRGLPDDACQCVHLGFVFAGRFRVRYTDGREETVGAGEAYRIEPGHVFETLEHTELIEFSPWDELRRSMDVIGRNVSAKE